MLDTLTLFPHVTLLPHRTFPYPYLSAGKNLYALYYDCPSKTFDSQTTELLTWCEGQKTFGTLPTLKRWRHLRNIMYQTLTNRTDCNSLLADFLWCYLLELNQLQVNLIRNSHRKLRWWRVVCPSGARTAVCIEMGELSQMIYMTCIVQGWVGDHKRGPSGLDAPSTHQSQVRIKHLKDKRHQRGCRGVFCELGQSLLWRYQSVSCESSVLPTSPPFPKHGPLNREAALTQWVMCNRWCFFPSLCVALFRKSVSRMCPLTQQDMAGFKEGSSESLSAA